MESTIPEATAYSFCSVALPNTVYAGPRTKKEFDKIALQEQVHGWAPSDVTSLLKRDGNQ